MKVFELDKKLVINLAQGKLDFFEPSLYDLMKRNLLAGLLEFTDDIKHAISCAQVVFIAVGFNRAFDGSSDISNVLLAA